MCGVRSRGWATATRAGALVSAVTTALSLTATGPAVATARSVSKVVVTAHPATVTATGTVAKPMDAVTIKGKATPASGRVVLERKVGKIWKDLSRAAVSSRTGQYVLVGHQLPVGRSSLRVVRAASGHTPAVASKAFSVTVAPSRTVIAPVPPAPAPGPQPPAPTPVAPVPDPPVAITCLAHGLQGSGGLMVGGLNGQLGYVGHKYDVDVLIFDGSKATTLTVLSPLPPGFVQDGERLVGTPTQTGVFSFQVLISDSDGNSATGTFCMQFAQPLRLTEETLPQGDEGQAYDQPLPLVGGFLPVTDDYEQTLRLNQNGLGYSTTAHITGAPTYTGSKSFLLDLTDGAQLKTDVMVTVPSTPPTSPRTLHVPGDAATIQGAIDAAQPGDTVLVAPGTYRENLDYDGKAITVRSVAGAATTVIDGGATASVVTFNRNESRDAVLDGFTLRNGAGAADWGSDRYYRAGGGGIGVWDASPTIEHNVVIDNVSTDAAVTALWGSPLIKDNTIANNDDVPYVGWGGGLMVGATAGAVITGNTIENNHRRDGMFGGASVGGTDTLFQDNIVTGNVTAQGGAGLEVQAAPGLRVVDNLVTGNVGPEAVYVVGNYASSSLVGNTIADNAGIGMFLEFGLDKVLIKDTVLSGGSASVACSDGRGSLGTVGATFDHVDLAGATVPTVCGIFDAAHGDITAVPSYQVGGYLPAAGSALVDAGVADPALPATDLLGGARVGGGSVDIGAYERQ